MIYRGSWRNTSGLGMLVLALVLLFAISGLYMSAPLLLGIAAALAVWLFALRLLWVRFGPISLEYRGWSRLHSVQWREIVAVTHALDLPYPKNRLYSPSSYEVRTGSETFIINLLYFPAAAAREFAAHTRTPKRAGLDA